MDSAVETLLAWKALVVVVWAVGFFIAERRFPAARRGAALPRASDDLDRVARNLALWLINVGLAPLLVLPLTYWAANHSVDWRADWWGGAVGLLLDLLLLDFLIYWWHRANHRVAFLWRFHAIHHADRFLDTTSALRFHFGEVLLSALARAGVVILLDLPFTSILIFEILVLLAALFHHANLALPARLEGALARLVITPSLHWVHHHAIQSDTDSNYGTLLSVWDRLFASRSATRRYPEMTIGIQGETGDSSLLRLLQRPFRRILG